MSKNYLYAEQFWNFQYLMVFISTDTPPPQICSGFMELCQAMSHLDPSGTSLSWADHLSKHVETCRISIPHLHFICIISHISTDSKKIKKEEVVLSEPWTQQAQTWFQSFHLGYATGDSSKYRYRCQVRSQSFNYQDTCKQTCACKGTSRAQEWEEPFLLSTCGLVWSGLICIRLHLHQTRLSYKASPVIQPYPVKWRLPSLQTWKRPMPPT